MYFESRKYVYLWSKYRPAVLKLMSAATSGPQQYQFYPHEFRNLNPKEKGGYAFSLKVFKGKAINNIKGFPVAMDLLQILQDSGVASALMNEAVFELSLDKEVMLHVSRDETDKESSGDSN